MSTTAGGDQGEPLDGEYDGSYDDGEYNDEDHFDQHGDNDSSSGSPPHDFYQDGENTSDFKDEEIPTDYDDDDGDDQRDDGLNASTFTAPAYRESLGFMRARRKLDLPGVGLGKGEVDDSRIDGLAVMDRFGFILVSSSAGKLFVFVIEQQPGVAV